jgi:hypothetical protein
VEVFLIILAIWLVLIGLYGLWPYLSVLNLGVLVSPPRASVLPALDVQERYNDQIAAAAAALAQPEFQPPPRPVVRAVEARPSQSLPRPTVPAAAPSPSQPLPPSAAPAAAPSLSSEVDMLRAQVEQLRSQIVALSTTAPRQDRSRPRRYRTGPYAYLPQPLREHVRELRLNRRGFSF